MIDIQEIINFNEDALKQKAKSAANLIIKEKQDFEKKALDALKNLKQKSAQK